MEEEIEILETIYNDNIQKIDLKCSKPVLEITLYPADSDDSHDGLNNKQCVCVNLIVYFPLNYPNETPTFELRNIRGVSDESVLRILDKINDTAKKLVGTQMMFEVFQEIKELLTEHGNIPKDVVCAICLYNFDENESFVKLNCFHYFHIKCLNVHLEYMERDIEKERIEAEINKMQWSPRYISCPTCRNRIDDDQLDKFKSFNSKCNSNSNELDNRRFDNSSFQISARTRDMQKHMKVLFEKQKQLGGIIDVDENKQDVIVLRRPTDPIPNLNAISNDNNSNIANT